MVSRENGWTEVLLTELMVMPLAGPVARLNAAVTAWLELMVTVQLPVPEQAPDHPVNVEPVLGVATSVTTVPAAKLRQLAPQLRLEEDELALIVPLPVPDVPVVSA